MTDVFSTPPMVVTNETNNSRSSADGAKDLFSLLYVTESRKDRTVVPPSRWATFECENIFVTLNYFFYFSRIRTKQ